MVNALLAERTHALWVGASINLTGVGMTSLWINAKNARRFTIYLIKGAWASATPAFTLLQATSNAGAGSKALNFDRYWKYTGAQTAGVDIPTEVAVASTNTFNLANQANELVWLEFMATHMDFNNGFNHFGFTVADPSANDILAALVLASDLDHEAYPTRQLTMLD